MTITSNSNVRLTEQTVFGWFIEDGLICPKCGESETDKEEAEVVGYPDGYTCLLCGDTVGVTEPDPFKGMWVAGWITSTQTSDGLVHYGPFDTKELALEWGKELTNVEVYRVFVPSWNAG